VGRAIKSSRLRLVMHAACKVDAMCTEHFAQETEREETILKT